MNYNQKVGKYGETLAKKYLIKKGYQIIEQNIQAGRQEIDIIAKNKGFFIFIEVKTRASSTYGTAEDSINTRKLANFKKAVTKYICRNKISADNIRFDFIAIDINKPRKTAKITHYEDIF